MSPESDVLWVCVYVLLYILYIYIYIYICIETFWEEIEMH